LPHISPNQQHKISSGKKSAGGYEAARSALNFDRGAVLRLAAPGAEVAWAPDDDYLASLITSK